ncbi:zinc finger CCCH domain-containing protein 3 isoform X2 [Brienomyrus brachyistius]|uniref:zinc finger CCCH domain-containing protein 3 isoform X2 n=1 Tax=Brienomyrus brachyistius TaxID=42636 RepID=UPI0020B21CF9|nr:zinc finger CCCH domain-containing protein 3 isoform X2 [Brienomyrus brachyistius]
MEERESLKRQIELLQSLINNHKSIHGNTPSGAGQWRNPVPSRGRGHGAEFPHSFPTRPGLYAPRPVGHWRKKYSLNNRSATALSGATDPSSSGSSLGQEGPLVVARPPTTSASSQPAPITNTDHPATITKERSSQGIKGRSPVGTAGLPKATGQPSLSAVSKPGLSRAAAPTAEATPLIMAQQGLRPAGTVTSSVQKQEAQSGPSFSVPFLLGTSGSLAKPKIGSAAPAAPTTPPPAPSGQLQHKLPSGAKANPGRLPGNPAPLKRSKFTWVKGSEVPAAAPSFSEAAGSRVPGIDRKPPRRPSLSPPQCRLTSAGKYTWVSAVAGRQARPSKRLQSPRGPDMPAKKPKPSPSQAAKPRRGSLSGASAVAAAAAAAHSSRYRWKAAGVVAKGTMAKGGGSVYCWKAAGAVAKGAVAKGGSSAYRWSSDRTPRGTSPITGSFRLKSRMKIIRGKPYGSVSTVPAVMGGYFSVRRRSQPAGRRGLVAIGRHRLCRLSPTASPGLCRAGPSSPTLRSPASLRVIKTRYKIVTRQGLPGATHSPSYGPTLSWRTKKVQCARTLLQNRLRTPPGPLPDQGVRPWRGRGMRWIGGALYRVSANKLCRTASPSSPTISPRLRIGRSLAPQDLPAHISPNGLSRGSSTRYLASRALQRSRSVIRHALQRHQRSKQYCMYYNRFGRCSRGEGCPYIHDPDKVAVCTRFLRGTCKQADGTCPFSHKVSKEKMPVCSFYLRGICNNSSCPYSHVYVSRKAAICQDFVRGYCPQGEKCKKKHTLVCPDFSSADGCPRGSRCQLQHRLPSKRPGQRQTSTPARRNHRAESPERLEVAECSQAGGGTPADPNKLPSFISLSSSPETPEPSDASPAEGLEGSDRSSLTAVPERKLQIKPRF